MNRISGPTAAVVIVALLVFGGMAALKVDGQTIAEVAGAFVIAAGALERLVKPSDSKDGAQ